MNYEEIQNSYRKWFIGIQHFEDYRLDLRFGDFFIVRWLPKAVKQLVMRKQGGLVFICSKAIKK
jgi:hypothetical protein